MKISKLLQLLLALFLIPALVIPVFNVAKAVDIPPTNPMTGAGGQQNPSFDPILYETDGQATLESLSWNPEWLKLETVTDIHSQTTIIVQGLDTYYQNVEAKVVIPAGTPAQTRLIINDTHTNPQVPVTFAKIIGVFQQNGTSCNSVKILTYPNQLQQYFGQYHNNSGFEVGIMSPPFGANEKYLVASAPHTYPWEGPLLPAPHPLATTQNVPVEPVNAEPLKIVINWQDFDHDLQIDPGELGTAQNTVAVNVTIEGLNEHGEKMIVDTLINPGASQVEVDAGHHTWSTVCKVWGGGQDSYYILSHPKPERGIFKYFIRIHHLAIYPVCYDILASGNTVDPLNAANYPGVTDITVALEDVDGHFVHAGVMGTVKIGQVTVPRNITVNFYTSGGKIQPSYDVQIPTCHITATVNLTADTNARTIKVVADANVPSCSNFLGDTDPLNLIAWTELTFDGINSVQTKQKTIHPLEWGWETYNQYGTIQYANSSILKAPPKPPLPEWLGGPHAGSLLPPWKLDGPIYEVEIPIYPGCNLISSPVYPILCNNYYSEAWGGHGIPMDLLFGMTSATDTLEAIWWYNSSKMWDMYIPGVTATPSGKNFTDGVGYWIKAEKPCTLEISGVEMENAPFVPREYPVLPSWNLMGITTIHEINTTEYLGSLKIDGEQFYGPVWVYDAQYGAWHKNPATLWPGFGIWMYYKDNSILKTPTVAP